MTRRSERELERTIDQLDGDDDFPEAGLITVLSTLVDGGDFELVDRECRLLLVNNKPHRATNEFTARMKWAPSEEGAP